MNKITDFEISKQLGSIGALAGIACIGILFPLIGWICGGIASSKLNAITPFIEEDKELFERYGHRMRRTRNTINFAIIFSTIVFGFSLCAVVFYWMAAAVYL